MALLRETLPELGGIEERRFAPGRFKLQAVCGCEAAEAARRLDGLVREGLAISAAAEGASLRLRVARVEPPAAAAPPASLESGQPFPGAAP